VDCPHSVAHCACDCRYVGGFAELAIDYNGFFRRLCDGCQRPGQGSIDVEQYCYHRFYDRNYVFFFASWIYNHGFLGSNFRSSSYPVDNGIPLGLLFDPFESVVLYLASMCFLQGVIWPTIDSRLHLCFVRFRRNGTHDVTPPAFVVNTMNYVVADGRPMTGAHRQVST